MQFIADIRGARVRELEEKRINKEMANIRKKFKGAVDSPMEAYFNSHIISQTEIWMDTRRKSEPFVLFAFLTLTECLKLKICGKDHLHIYPWL